MVAFIRSAFIRLVPIAFVFIFATIFKGVSFNEFYTELLPSLKIILLLLVLYVLIGKVITMLNESTNRMKLAKIKNIVVANEVLDDVEKEVKKEKNTKTVKLNFGCFPIVTFITIPLYLFNVITLATYGKVLVGVELFLGMFIVLGFLTSLSANLIMKSTK